MIFQKLLPPVWLLFSMILMIIIHFLSPIKQLFLSPINYLGIVLIAIGIIIALTCAYLFRQQNTTIKPFQESSHLVDTGLFSYSRNPIYLGMIIALMGLWVFLGSLTPSIVIFVFIWLIQEKFIKEEEKMLEDKFGEKYQEYKATVRRWI